MAADLGQAAQELGLLWGEVARVGNGHLDGDHLVAPAAAVQAVLGTTVEVETLHGQTPLDIPAGTAHGRDFRLRGQGIDRLDGSGRGDHVVTVEVAVPHPRDLNPEEVQILRRLAEIGGHPVKEERTVLDRVKDLFG